MVGMQATFICDRLNSPSTPAARGAVFEHELHHAAELLARQLMKPLGELRDDDPA